MALEYAIKFARWQHPARFALNMFAIIFKSKRQHWK